MEAVLRIQVENLLSYLHLGRPEQVEFQFEADRETPCPLDALEPSKSNHFKPTSLEGGRME